MTLVVTAEQCWAVHWKIDQNCGGRYSDFAPCGGVECRGGTVDWENAGQFSELYNEKEYGVYSKSLELKVTGDWRNI